MLNHKNDLESNSLEEYIPYFRVKMQELGYVEGEVNAFVHDVIKESKATELSPDEGMEILDYMKSYLLFAQKCKKIV